MNHPEKNNELSTNSNRQHIKTTQPDRGVKTISKKELTASEAQAKNNLLISYLIFGIGLISMIPWLLAVIYLFYTRNTIKETYFVDHYEELKSLVIHGGVWFLIGLATSPFVFGIFILFSVYVYSIVILVKGGVRTFYNMTYSGKRPE